MSVLFQLVEKLVELFLMCAAGVAVWAGAERPAFISGRSIPHSLLYPIIIPHSHPPRPSLLQLIDDAPYLLEPLIDGIKDEPSMPVRCELLTATVKLFFKRPPGERGRAKRCCLSWF